MSNEQSKFNGGDRKRLNICFCMLNIIKKKYEIFVFKTFVKPELTTYKEVQLRIADSSFVVHA